MVMISVSETKKKKNEQLGSTKDKHTEVKVKEQKHKLNTVQKLDMISTAHRRTN